LNDGKKIRSQMSHNSILEWTSAEIWLYIYANGIVLNDAYKKGSARVGCICCPMGGGKSGFIEYNNYKSRVDCYFEIIRKSNGRKNINIDEYIANCGWSARKNGRDLAENPNHCTERIENESLTITVENPTSDWREWIKTLDLPNDTYSVSITSSGYIAQLNENVAKNDPLLSRLFRQVFHKAACCTGCKVCEANCPYGALHFVDNHIHIRDCVHCHKCYAIDSGCLHYHSLRHPQGASQMKTLNTMSNHAPKTEWLADFFKRKNDFLIDNSLNKKNQLGPFCRFLRNANLIDKSNKVTPFMLLMDSIGWESETAQGLILVNLVAENPQMEWYVGNLEKDQCYPKKDFIEMLLAAGVELSKSGKYDAHESIHYAFKRLVETPLGTSLHWGYVTEEGELVRTKCTVSDPRVVLYGLFKFAEKCNDYKDFTLATLLNDSIDRDGISPTRIFGLDREDMVPMLLGLAAKYPDFITASFTHDLDKISLAKDKSSQDVLDLFEGNEKNV
ncbi:MAG: phosphoadenosine phosphosulfate reductase family protein, partial [Fibrobacter sp.]|nr:phosphoadenosine phosphosulfate reductase family protein [Fibrobacter sp.]